MKEKKRPFFGPKFNQSRANTFIRYYTKKYLQIVFKKKLLHLIPKHIYTTHIFGPCLLHFTAGVIITVHQQRDRRFLSDERFRSSINRRIATLPVANGMIAPGGHQRHCGAMLALASVATRTLRFYAEQISAKMFSSFFCCCERFFHLPIEVFTKSSADPIQSNWIGARIQIAKTKTDNS